MQFGHESVSGIASHVNLFPSHSRCRKAMVLANVLVAVALTSVIVLSAWWFWPHQTVPPREMLLLDEVFRGPFEHVVLEQGEVESSNSVEIRCEVKSRSGGGSSTTILDVIPEGTPVQEGDWLVTLDSSALEEERGRQKIMVNTSEAIMIQAQADFETAKIAKTEYLEGTFIQEEKTILNEIYVAEDALKKSQLELQSAQRLLTKGLLTDLQLEAQRFAVAKTRNDLDVANTRLKVLRDYTKKKMLTQLDSDIKASEVKWLNEQDNHVEEVRKLEKIETQIQKCKIIAPQDGVVVYANVRSGRSNEFIVEPGTPVREQQVVIRLPDPNQMQVKAEINEARINLVQAGQPVTIRIDALGDHSFHGEVIKVNKYAEPGQWWKSTSKEYATYIRILDPPADILTGLTAEVRIHVERSDDVLQLPILSIYETAGRTFCLVQDQLQWTTRQVDIVSTNGKMVAIDEEQSDPIHVGEKVVANARKHVDKFKIPDVKPPVTGERQVKVVGLDVPGNRTDKEDSQSDVTGTSSPQRLQGSSSDTAGDILRRLDQDNDGKLSNAELAVLPEAARNGISQADTNSDGMIDQNEMAAAFARYKETKR